MTTPKAMILAAGFGTRLGALTQQRPKPMLPIAGTPLVRWSVLWLRHQGVRQVVINLHHLGEQIQDELGDGSSLDMEILYSKEDTILGTGGGLRQAREWLDDGSGDPILVINGKILFELELNKLLEFHRNRQSEATMVLREDREQVWGGKLATDCNGGMGQFLGETRPDTSIGTPMMFTGIHLFEPRFLDRVPPQGEQCIVRTAYRQLFQEGCDNPQSPSPFGAYVTDGYWWEHSTPERYLQGIRNVLDGHVSLPHAEHHISGIHPSAQVHPESTITPPVWIGENARIERGAQVGPYVQMGKDASVAVNAKIRDTTIWDHCRAISDKRNEVVTNHG